MPADDRVLTDGDVEAIAEATATRLAAIVSSAPGTFGLVSARELAEGLGVSLDYVYAHAAELGAMRLGSGPKARIRFDLDRAREALEARTRRPKWKATAVTVPSPDPKNACRGAARPRKRFAQCWIVPELAGEVCDDETVE